MTIEQHIKAALESIGAATTLTQADPTLAGSEVERFLGEAVKDLGAAHGYLMLYASGKKRKRVART